MGSVAQWLEHRTDDWEVLGSNLLRQCLSEETLIAVGPFYLVSMPGDVQDTMQGVICNLLWTPYSRVGQLNPPVLAVEWAVEVYIEDLR